MKRLKEYDKGYLAALAEVETSIRDSFPVTPVANALYNYGGGLDDALAMISGKATAYKKAVSA